jgi:hypothetical protein
MTAKPRSSAPESNAGKIRVSFPKLFTAWKPPGVKAQHFPVSASLSGNGGGDV